MYIASHVKVYIIAYNYLRHKNTIIIYSNIHIDYVCIYVYIYIYYIMYSYFIYTYILTI